MKTKTTSNFRMGIVDMIFVFDLGIGDRVHKVPMITLLQVLILFAKQLLAKIIYCHGNISHNYAHTYDIFVTKCDSSYSDLAAGYCNSGRPIL